VDDSTVQFMIRERGLGVLLSILLLVGAYFDQTALVWLAVGLISLEAAFGFFPTSYLSQRGTRALVAIGAGPLLSSTTGLALADGQDGGTCSLRGTPAQRLWRLAIAMVLAASLVSPAYLWFFPWFLSFALAGAALSGVCPLFAAVVALGVSDEI
jgi:hypothetical protein